MSHENGVGDIEEIMVGRIVRSPSSITSHSNRPLDVIAFLGHDHFVIDDSLSLGVNQVKEERGAEQQDTAISEKEPLNKANDEIELTEMEYQE